MENDALYTRYEVFKVFGGQAWKISAVCVTAILSLFLREPAGMHRVMFWMVRIVGER